MALYVGTSGWIYKHWASSFYPEGIGRRHLPFYAATFNTVELNASFYRLPTLKAAQGWHDAVPDDFVFAVKGSRFITHMKKLDVTKDSIAIFFERIAPLARKIGVLLWQLPPMLTRDVPRLERFLRLLPKRFTHAVEFRHPSWYDGDDALDALRAHGAAHVSISSGIMPMRLDRTADVAYLRFHGLSGGAAHDYTTAGLRPWVRYARRCLAEGVRVYAYFNNDLNARAPGNAIAFRDMVRGTRPTRRVAPGAAPPFGRTRRARRP